MTIDILLLPYLLLIVALGIKIINDGYFSGILMIIFGIYSTIKLYKYEPTTKGD